jgi:hypothetical protein
MVLKRAPNQTASWGTSKLQPKELLPHCTGSRGRIVRDRSRTKPHHRLHQQRSHKKVFEKAIYTGYLSRLHQSAQSKTDLHRRHFQRRPGKSYPAIIIAMAYLLGSRVPDYEVERNAKEKAIMFQRFVYTM